MVSVALCPLALIPLDGMTPDQFERERMSAAKQHVEALEATGMRNAATSEVLNQMQCHLWERIADPAWKGYILSWVDAVVVRLERLTDIVASSADAQAADGLDCEQIASPDVREQWAVFLKSWGATGPACRICSRGVTSVNQCAQLPEEAQANLIHLRNLEDWRRLKYPWLQVYSPNLPTEGEFPFEPPNAWKTTNPISKGPNHGHLDVSGNEWCHAVDHGGPHWDVQLTDCNNYVNVAYDGRKL